MYLLRTVWYVDTGLVNDTKRDAIIDEFKNRVEYYEIDIPNVLRETYFIPVAGNGQTTRCQTDYLPLP